MLTREQVLALTGRDLDAAVAEYLFGHTGIGYYGPPPDPTREWAHLDSVRYDTQAEAEAAFQRYYETRYPDIPRGIVTPDLFTAYLCWWKDGWGPLTVDEYSTDASDDYELLEYIREEWGERLWIFTLVLYQMLGKRDQSENGTTGIELMVRYYRIGDYARAALLTLTKE